MCKNVQRLALGFRATLLWGGGGTSLLGTKPRPFIRILNFGASHCLEVLCRIGICMCVMWGNATNP
jgi:hypothetical protein